MKRIVFILGYLWALPTTLVGLLLAFGGGCWPIAFRHGAIWFRVASRGPWLLWAEQGFRAITFGGVVIVSDDGDLESSSLVAHELRHFWQARILGPLFLPVYLAAWLSLVFRGRRDSYSANFLEVDARNHEQRSARG